MSNHNELEQQLSEIRQQLEVVTEYVRAEQRRQREMTELKQDLALIGKDVFQAAVVELEEVGEHFDSQDLLFLLKKLLRNTRNLNKMLDQVESVYGFWEDAKPLGKEVFSDLLEHLDQFDRKGYFEFLKAMLQLFDTIVTSFTVEDVTLLRENIVSILLTIKNLTQPDMLKSLNNTVSFFQKMDVAVEKDVSLLALMKEFRDPEVRRGIAFLLTFAKNMASVKGNDASQLAVRK
jgi:uncharacterized protein YjgD (DUF1641 family)